MNTHKTKNTKKQERMARRTENGPYYVFVKNARTGYTKLVSQRKGMEYVYGKRSQFTGLMEHDLKDRYVTISTQPESD